MQPKLSVSGWFSVSSFTVGAICLLLSVSANPLHAAGGDDLAPPVISPMPDLTSTGTSATGAFVNFSVPTATDEDSDLQSVSCDRSPGVFPFGTTTVTCTATDSAGNTDSVSFTVTVNVQANHHLLTITVVGNGLTGAIGLVPLALVCNLPDSSGQCIYAVPAGTDLRVNGNAPQHPAVFSAGTGPASGCVTSTCRFIMSGPASITATFDPLAPFVTISITLAGDGPGEVFDDNSRCQNYDHDLSHLPTQYSACASNYAAGSEVDLLAWPPSASRFSEFSAGTGSAAVCGAAARCTFILNANESVTARFSALTSLAVTPATSTLNINQTRQYTATGTYSDSSIQGIFGGSGTWKTRTSMNQVRFNLAAAAVGGRVYALGGINGRDPGQVLGSVEAFDPATNTWAGKQAMTARAGMGAAAVDDRYIYVAGGNATGACPMDTLDRYDSQSDSWETLTPMPAGPRRNLSAAVVGRQLYAIGGELNVCGSSSGTPLGTMEAYDVDTGLWSARAPMPTPRSFFGVAVVDGIIYAVGGSAGSGNLATVEAYNPATNTWTTKTPMPSGRSLLAVAAIGKIVYAIGGNAGSYTDTVFAYDPSTNAWSNKVGIPSVIDTIGPNSLFSNIPGQRAELSAATLDGILYIMGGLVKDSGEPLPPPVNIVLSFVDGLVWNSSDTAVATIVNQNLSGFPFGRATARQIGTTNITARVGTLSCRLAGQCAILTVSVPPPPSISLGLPSSASTDVNSSNSFGCGSFFQSNVGTATFSATVNYGDGSGVQPMPLMVPGNSCGGGGGAPTGSFSFNHVYTVAGSFQVSVTVTNNSTGVSQTGGFPIQVREEDEQGCAVVTTNLVAGNVSFTTVQMSLFLRTTGELLFTEDVPLGTMELGSAPPGQYRVEFTVPAGYIITPSQIAFDAICGTSVTLSAQITAADTAPPVIASVTPDIESLSPPNKKMVPVVMAVSVTDAVDPAPVCSITGVSSNEAVGDTAPDWQFSANSLMLNFRAERDEARTYTVTVTCRDASGNSSTGSAAVYVPRGNGKEKDKGK